MFRYSGKRQSHEQSGSLKAGQEDRTIAIGVKGLEHLHQFPLFLVDDAISIPDDAHVRHIQQRRELSWGWIIVNNKVSGIKYLEDSTCKPLYQINNSLENTQGEIVIASKLVAAVSNLAYRSRARSLMLMVKPPFFTFLLAGPPAGDTLINLELGSAIVASCYSSRSQK